MSNLKKSRISRIASAFVGLTTSVVMMSAVAVLPAAAAFSMPLKMGVTSPDVMALQKALNADGELVATSGAGSPGMETSYFGSKTKAAVMKFQEKYAAEVLTPAGLTMASGYVGTYTNAKLNALQLGGSIPSAGPSTVPGCKPGDMFSSSSGKPCTAGSASTGTGSGLTVTASNAQPANGLAPAGAARLPFTKVILTASTDGDVSVKGLTIERQGPANDAVFNGIVLLDENGLQIGDERTFNSNHRLTLNGSGPIVVKAGSSRTFTIAGNMASASTLSSNAGQVAVLAVVGIDANAPVSAPVVAGAAHTINSSLTIGTAQATISSFDPNTALTKEIGTTAYKFAGVRVQAGSAEDVKLWSVRWRQNGSATASDFENLVTIVDGVAYPAVVSSDGKWYTSTFGAGLDVLKGFSKDIYIQGDIMGSNSSGRTVQFDLDKSTDVYITGNQFGYGITLTAATTGSVTTASEFTTGTPFFSGSVTTVSAGSVTTVVKSANVPAQNIAVNVPDQPIGGFDIDVKGEPITVQSLVFTVATSSGSGTGLLTNVSLVNANGAVVSGPVDATDPTATDGSQTLTFTGTVTFPVGKGTYKLVGRLPSASGNNQTIVVSTTPSSGWTNVRGLTSGNSLTLSNGAFSMNTMTVKAASLAISVSPTPVAQTVVSGGTDREFANYQLDASQSGEDVRFSNIPLFLTLGGGASATGLTNCRLYDGSTVLNTGSNVVNPSAAGANTFNFDQSLTVARGVVKTLKLKCTLSASATNTFSWGIAASPSIAVTGVVSSNDVSETVTASTGQVQTVGASIFTVTLDSATPAYTVAAAGQTGVVLGALKFRATNEAVNLEKIALQMSNSSASSSAQNLVGVTIWDGSTQVGRATFTGANRFATSTLDTIVMLPKDQDKVLWVKGDLATIGQGLSGTEGALIQVDYDGGDSTGTQGTGVESGTRINQSSSSDTATNGVRTYKSYPSMTYSTVGGTAINGSNDLLVLNIAAAAQGEVQMRKLTFTVSTTTATLSSPTFNGPNGSVGTTALSGDGTSITVTFDSATNVQDRTIAGGQSKNYTLRGTISLTGTNTTGAVTVALKADTAHASLATLMGTVTQLASSNTIWSPNATGTSDTTNPDWANNYGLPGCFTTSGLGQDCQSRTVAK